MRALLILFISLCAACVVAEIAAVLAADEDDDDNEEEKMTDEQKKAYCDFMLNPKNVGKCKNCPENRGYDGHEANGHPCGQQNCWVVAHIRHFGAAKNGK